MSEPTPEARALELEIEVPGAPEEVWQAIATGPGITAWFVPTTVEERAGGAVTQSFGEAEEMQVHGHVQAWEPPHRFAYGEQPEPTEGMAFEFLVEARDQGTCVVRLINSGFGHGEGWDDQFDAMENGWRIFFQVLALHLAHFAGRPAERVQAMTIVPATDNLWESLVSQFEIEGDRLAAGPAAPLAGQITFRGDRVLVFQLSEPAPGTGLLAVEGSGEQLSISLWLSLYGPAAADVVARDRPAWNTWAASLAT